MFVSRILSALADPVHCAHLAPRERALGLDYGQTEHSAVWNSRRVCHRCHKQALATLLSRLNDVTTG